MAKAPKTSRHHWEGGYWIMVGTGARKRRSYRIERSSCKLCGERHHIKVGNTEAEATSYLRAWEANGHRPPSEATKVAAEKDLNLADAIDKYMATVPVTKKFGTAHVRNLRRSLKTWTKFLLLRGCVRLSELREPMWEEFEIWRRKQPRKRDGKPPGDTTVYQDQIAMRGLVRWALGKHLDDDPFPVERCKAVVVDTESNQSRRVTLEDVKKLSAALLAPTQQPRGRRRRPEDAVRCNALLWAIYFFGARAASWRRAWTLDAETMTVWFPGSSNKNKRQHFVRTKDRKKWKMLVELEKVGVPKPHTWERAFAAAKIKAGLKHLRPHDLRAGCAQRLEAERKSTSAIMATMQWNSMKTARRYLRTEQHNEV